MDASGVVLNTSAFYAHLGGDKELGAEILTVYLDDAPQRFNSLVKALEEDDQVLAVKFSHALKGISATIRAERVSSLSGSAERAARQGDLEKAGLLIPEIENELKLVLQAIATALSA
ncbi:Hpt domain-containing protein [Maridesulfovibrio sp.]|uniref:Hpt domain-containing protein n=1 Tax=Maridesulfovibrio sp. TaxID=2795000 RepID=UPI002A18748B|nr:Hpt domain-containing protein [Maridesulfovibrio sp.]